MKTVAAIALALAFGVAAPARTHHHQQEAAQGVASNISDTDAWRHFLLHVAANLPTNTPLSNLGSDFQVLYNTAWKFRAEFEKAVDDFNAAQETRTEADQVAALRSFIVQRDAMVESYRKELMSGSRHRDGPRLRRNSRTASPGSNPLALAPRRG